MAELNFNLDDPQTRKKAFIAAGVAGVGIGVLFLSRRKQEPMPSGAVPVVQDPVSYQEESAAIEELLGQVGSNLDRLREDVYAYVDQQSQASEQSMQELGQQMADALGGVWSAVEELYYGIAGGQYQAYDGSYYGGVSGDGKQKGDDAKETKGRKSIFDAFRDALTTVAQGFSSALPLPVQLQLYSEHLRANQSEKERDRAIQSEQQLRRDIRYQAQMRRFRAAEEISMAPYRARPAITRPDRTRQYARVTKLWQIPEQPVLPAAPRAALYRPSAWQRFRQADIASMTPYRASQPAGLGEKLRVSTAATRKPTPVKPGPAAPKTTTSKQKILAGKLGKVW